MNGEFAVKFVPSGRGKVQCAPNPAYPDGINVRLAENGCLITLPYPAPECGHFEAQCKVCRRRIAITAAGRADDPRSVRVPCEGGVHN